MGFEIMGIGELFRRSLFAPQSPGVRSAHLAYGLRPAPLGRWVGYVAAVGVAAYVVVPQYRGAFVDGGCGERETRQHLTLLLYPRPMAATAPGLVLGTI